MVVAGGIAGRAVDNLARHDLDGVIGENVVDTDAGSFVQVDEIGRDGKAPSRERDCIPEPEHAEARKHQLAAVDELVDGPFGPAREAAEGLDQPVAIDAVLRADAIEVATDD